jgi:hypothetical protein
MYVPFVIITIHSFSHSWRITWFVTRWMPLVKQKMFPSGAAELTIGFMCSSFSFQCSILYLIVCFLILFSFVFSNFSCTVCCMSAITVNKLVFAFTAGFRYIMVILTCSNIRSKWNTTKPDDVNTLYYINKDRRLNTARSHDPSVTHTDYTGIQVSPLRPGQKYDNTIVISYS